MKKKTRPQREADFKFKEALTYLRRRYPRMKENWFRSQVQQDPEQFGAVRRNSCKRRGKGGAFGFYKKFLDQWEMYRPVEKEAA